MGGSGQLVGQIGVGGFDMLAKLAVGIVELADSCGAGRLHPTHRLLDMVDEKTRLLLQPSIDLQGRLAKAFGELRRGTADAFVEGGAGFANVGDDLVASVA